jgi:hypothetical protein
MGRGQGSQGSYAHRSGAVRKRVWIVGTVAKRIALALRKGMRGSWAR